jgi:uncharacterized protein YyaL (SSP411 family)
MTPAPADAAELDGDPESLSARARRARRLWDAHARDADARSRRAAEAETSLLIGTLFDADARAFRRRPGSRELPAEGNALAALALARAARAGVPGAAQAASAAVDFLRARLYDPLLGLLSAEGAAAPEYGLLGDVAWSALAAEELGREPDGGRHAAFAAELADVLVRDLWDPGRGGFAARIPRAGEGASPPPDSAAEAAALEVCARLGRGRAFALGLAAARAAAGADAGARAALERVAALAANGAGDGR